MVSARGPIARRAALVALLALAAGLAWLEFGPALRAATDTRPVFTAQVVGEAGAVHYVALASWGRPDILLIHYAGPVPEGHRRRLFLVPPNAPAVLLGEVSPRAPGPFTERFRLGLPPRLRSGRLSGAGLRIEQTGPSPGASPRIVARGTFTKV